MATIAAAAIAAGASYYASRQAGKRSRQEREAADRMGRNAETAGEYGEDFLGMSKEALGPVYEYFKTLSTGDREALMRYLSPEIMAQTEGSKRAFQTGSQLAPRSGAGTEAVSAIPTQNSSAIARMIAGARPAGIAGLASLGTSMGSLGMSGLTGSNAATGGVLDYEGNRRRQQQQAGMDAASSAYEIFKMFQGNGANAGSAGGGAGSGWNPEYMNFWRGGG